MSFARMMEHTYRQVLFPRDLPKTPAWRTWAKKKMRITTVMRLAFEKHQKELREKEAVGG